MHATYVGDWFRDALRRSWAIACFCGEEYYPLLERAVRRLMVLHEEKEYLWTRETVLDVWAERLWRWTNLSYSHSTKNHATRFFRTFGAGMTRGSSKFLQ